nr:hypothetical protein [Marseillevirus cajuinensis]WRK65251.1 hypothetical protein MarFTME_206 [Marseillevirus futianmevirus]
MNTNLCHALKEQVKNLLEDLCEVFKDEPEKKADVRFVQLFFSVIPEEKLMEHFVKFVLPHADKIHAKNEDFFIKNTDLWKGLPDEKVKMVSEMWVTGRLDPDDKQMMWDYFECFVELAKSWRKRK